MSRRFGAVIVAIVVLAAAAPATLATTTRMECTSIPGAPVETTGTVTWDGTVMHVRGTLWDMANESDCPMLDGSVHVVINYDLDVATGLGELWGTDTFSPAAYSGSGFRDHYTGTFAGGMPPYWSGKGVGHGFGELSGWQIREPLGNHPVGPTVLFYPGS
jgi:hypothetical protein